MTGTRVEQIMPFATLQATIDRSAHSLFPLCNPSVAILPLPSLTSLNKHSRQAFLHPQEVRQLAEFKYNKRSTEWLGGRLCAKQSLSLFSHDTGLHVLQPIAHHYHISSKDSGQPFFSCNLHQPPYILPQLSISHSKELATALCASGRCGIDIQYQAQSLIRVREKFLNCDEEKLLHTLFGTSSSLAGLSLVWAAKEAIKKMLSSTGMPGFHDLCFVDASVDDTSNGVLYLAEQRRYHSTFAVAVGIQSPGYAIALCCEPQSSSEEGGASCQNSPK